MSEKSFVEKLAAQRQKHVNALLTMPDGDVHAHARVRGHIAGLDEAMNIYRQENKAEEDKA